jgi:hypothetical protein
MVHRLELTPHSLRTETFDTIEGLPESIVKGPDNASVFRTGPSTLSLILPYRTANWTESL